MTISKEVKIGFFGLLLVFASLFVVNFFKQNNYFSTNMVITGKFSNIEFLRKGNLVLMKGRPVGYVVAVYKEGADLFIDMDIEGDSKIPQNATAIITELSLMGGRTISINFEGECADNCLTSGATIPGKVYTMKEQVEEAATPILKKFGAVADTLLSPSALQAMLDDAQASVQSLSKTTAGLKNKMKGMSSSLPKTVKSFREMTQSLMKMDASQIKNNTLASVGDAATQKALDSLLENLASLTQEDIDAMTQILYTAAKQMQKLPAYIEKGEKAITKADTTIVALQNKINGFQEGASGTIPKLLYNAEFKDSLYNNVQNASQKINNIRLHPEQNLSLKKKK